MVGHLTQAELWSQVLPRGEVRGRASAIMSPDVTRQDVPEAVEDPIDFGRA